MLPVEQHIEGTDDGRFIAVVTVAKRKVFSGIYNDEAKAANDANKMQQLFQEKVAYAERLVLDPNLQQPAARGYDHSKARDNYRARIVIDKKTEVIGTFDTANEARCAYLVRAMDSDVKKGRVKFESQAAPETQPQAQERPSAEDVEHFPLYTSHGTIKGYAFVFELGGMPLLFGHYPGDERNDKLRLYGAQYRKQLMSIRQVESLGVFFHKVWTQMAKSMPKFVQIDNADPHLLEPLTSTNGMYVVANPANTAQVLRFKDVHQAIALQRAFNHVHDTGGSQDAKKDLMQLFELLKQHQKLMAELSETTLLPIRPDAKTGNFLAQLKINGETRTLGAHKDNTNALWVRNLVMNQYVAWRMFHGDNIQ